MYDLIMKKKLNFPIFGDVFDIMSNNKLISYQNNCLKVQLIKMNYEQQKDDRNILLMTLSPDQKLIALYKEDEVIYIHKTTDY